VDTRVALADIVVVDRAGRELARVAIEPVLPDRAYAGMSDVAGLAWISASRLVVHGPINPSQSQYYVIDLARQAVVEDFIDDESAPAFSPDGLHVAILAGAPHFVPPNKSAARLLLDGKTIYPARPVAGLDFVSEPKWSADGSSLAWAVHAPETAHASLVVWHGGETRGVMIPSNATGDLSVSWSGANVLVRAQEGGADGRPLSWFSDANASPLVARVAQDPLAAGIAMRDTLAERVRAEGIAEPNFWCTGCALSVLPRASY